MRFWLFLSGALATLACGGAGGGRAAPRDSTTAVRVMELSAAESEPRIAASGAVVAERQVVLRAESSGLVAEVRFDHGQEVKQGDVMVRLVDGDARASVAEGEASVKLAAAQLTRVQGLFGRDNASRAEVDRAEAESALARARLDRAREALRRTVIRAPFAGVAGIREVVRGDLLQPGAAVTTLVDLSALAVDVPLSERDLGLVAPGTRAELTVDTAPGRTFAGEVVYVAPGLDPGTRTGRVRIAVRDRDPAIRPGATARASLLGETGPALRVPTNAVLTTPKGSAVYVVAEGDKAELRPVVTAERDAEKLRVVEGLAPGDRVVVEGLIRLRPGATVRVLP